MRFVQKSPLLLAIACMILSSCAKEDLQAPTPAAEAVESGSNLKIEAAVPFISSTKAVYLGEGIYPSGWNRNEVGFSTNKAYLPTGSSNRAKLWGEPTIPFVSSMSVIPGGVDYEFLTVTTVSTNYNTSKSSVKTKITDLIVGKTYALKVYVGSNLPKAAPDRPYATFAKSSVVKIGSQENIIDLSISYNGWVQKEITFTATSPQMDFVFSASPGKNGQYAYAHIVVPFSAIKKLN